MPMQQLITLALNRNWGGRFYDEMERLIQDIRKQPNLFRLWSPPIRRRPDYWKRRLK